MAEQVSFGSSTAVAAASSGRTRVACQSSNNMDCIEKVLEDYSNQLIKFVDAERELETQQCALSADVEMTHRLPSIVKSLMDNRERVEMLFLELSQKMWNGQLPAVSIAIIERQYRESTGRLLSEDLREAQWPAYFSAYQLSVDILNGAANS